MAKDTDLDKQLSDLQNQEGRLDPEQQDNSKYKPNKRKRAIRRQVYERFYELRDDPLRQEAEAEWEIADREFGMVTDEQDPDDWHSHIQLPDAFSAIQTQSQETIERKSRPHLLATEESDEPIADFANSVMTYNMNNTGYDYQAFLSKLSASSRGTAFRRDYWRTEKRTVKLPESLNADGTIKYKTQEIIDFDDDYCEWMPNEFVFPDEKAKHIDEAVDWIRREVINIEEFHRIYGNKPGFFDTEYVMQGGDTGNRSIFRLPKDAKEQDVEVLHYENRSIDAYWVVANNITICDSPLMTKHKELSLAVDYQYRIPGRFWGIGIPRVLHHLSEERKTIRNLNLDRQKIIIAGAFLHNNSYDLDDEDTELEPGRMISVDTNGQDIRAAITQVQMGDTPASSFKTEEILLEDIRRASGIDDRISVSNSATTATQAAIVKESTLKRINLISISNEMDTVIRIGRIKWSNIQFFYGTPRIEKIVEKNEEREENHYRTINVQGKKFRLEDENGTKTLKMEDIKGASALALKPQFNKYLEGQFDISVDADIFTAPSKAIEQTKKTEVFSLMISNPATMAVLDVMQASGDMMKVNNINPDVWLKNFENKKDMQMMAEAENMLMANGQPLAGTPNATEDHTLVHLVYTKSQEFAGLADPIKQIIMDHILQEHDNNPATGASADLMKQHGLGQDQLAAGAAGQMAGAIPGMGSPFDGGVSSNTSQPQAQVADVQPTNFANPE